MILSPRCAARICTPSVAGSKVERAIAVLSRLFRRKATILAAFALLALVLLLDAPLWLVPLVPTQDGPVHLAQADLIARFGWGGAMADPAASFYQWNPGVGPNVAVDLLLAGLIRLTGSTLAANTLFLTLYGLLWVAAAATAARAETDRPLLPTLLLVPLAFGGFIHQGLYGFALGLPLFLLFAACRRRREGRRDLVVFAGTALLLAALVLAHAAALLAACLLLAADGLERAVRNIRRIDPGATLRGLLRDAAWATSAALPALVLAASVLPADHAAAPALVARDGGVALTARRIADLACLFSFTWWEVVALAPVLAALAGAGVAAMRRFRADDLRWPIFLVLVLVASALDLRTGTAPERLAPFCWIAVVLTIASRQGSVMLARATCLAAAIGLCGQSAVRAHAYRNWSPILTSALDLGADHPGQTYANVDLIPATSAQYSWRVRPALHASQIAALAGSGVGLSSPASSTRYLGDLPLRYVESRDLLRAVEDWDGDPAGSPIWTYRSANGGAPQILMVTAIDDAAEAFAGRIGYAQCGTKREAGRRLAACVGPFAVRSAAILPRDLRGAPP